MYEAWQSSPVTRKVALKVLKRGMDTDEVVRRFEAERQALAVMSHPNIAKVHDAGATDDGRPFFAMELVAGGLPITDYCEENRLPLEDRLKLFVEVCWAIQHAHQKSVIHRDIKPSNILIARRGDEGEAKCVLKVIDFGIAKATDRDLTDATLYTLPNQVMGTPRYMSPEQADPNMRGDIDTRSDIYSLGVLLFELLVGRHPLGLDDGEEATFEETRRRILEVEARKPSTAIGTLSARQRSRVAQARKSEPHKLKGILNGDLDWIVLMALEKDRDLRYPSAASLALDINRFFDDQPISAKAHSASYLVRKFARRHKLALIVSTVIAAMLIVATVVSTFYAGVAREQKASARIAKRTMLRELGGQLLASNNYSGALLPLADAVSDIEKDRDARDFNLRSIYRLRFGSVLDRIPRLASFWEAPSLGSHCVSLDQDGFIVAGYENGRIYRFEPENPSPSVPIQAHEGAVKSLRFDEERARYITASSDRRAKVWRAGTTKPEIVLPHPEEVNSAKFVPGKNWCTTACDDGIARLWDLKTQKILATFTHPNPTGDSVRDQNGVLDVDVSGDGRLLATASEDSTVRLWEIGNGESPQSERLLNSLDHRRWVYSVEFSRDGTKLVTTSTDGMARIYNTEGDLLQSLPHPRPVKRARFSPDGRRVVTACDDGAVRVWDAQAGREASPAMWHETYPFDVVFSPQGHQVISTTAEGVVRLWDLTSTFPSFEFSDLQQFLPDLGSQAVVVEDKLFVKDSRTSKNLRASLLHLDEPLTPDETLVTAFGNATNGALKLVTKMGDQQRFRLRLLGSESAGVQLQPFVSTAPIAISADGRSHAASNGTTVTLFRPEQPQAKLHLAKHMVEDKAVQSIVFNPVDSGQLAVVTKTSVWLWDGNGGPPRRLAFEQHDDDLGLSKGLEIYHLEFSPDGNRLVIARGDYSYFPGVAQIWPTAGTGTNPVALKHPDGVNHATFDASGSRILTSGDDSAVRLWEQKDNGWEPVLILNDHDGDVLWADFSPDGSMIATAASDSTVRVWETATGDPITPPIGPIWTINTLMHVQFVEGGKSLYVGRRTGQGTVIPLTPATEEVADLQLIAQLLHGRRIDETGESEVMLPLDSRELRKKWDTLRQRHSDRFRASTRSEVVDWHRRERSAARAFGDENAATFHEQWLPEANP